MSKRNEVVINRVELASKENLFTLKDLQKKGLMRPSLDRKDISKEDRQRGVSVNAEIIMPVQEEAGETYFALCHCSGEAYGRMAGDPASVADAVVTAYMNFRACSLRQHGHQDTNPAFYRHEDRLVLTHDGASVTGRLYGRHPALCELLDYLKRT